MQVYLLIQPGLQEDPELMTAVPAAQMRGATGSASEDGFPGWQLEASGQDANDIPDPVSSLESSAFALIRPAFYCCGFHT